MGDLAAQVTMDVRIVGGAPIGPAEAASSAGDPTRPGTTADSVLNSERNEEEGTLIEDGEGRDDPRKRLLRPGESQGCAAASGAASGPTSPAIALVVLFFFQRVLHRRRR